MIKKASKEARRLDTTDAGRGLWLVKVPKYMSDAWVKAGPQQPLGILKIASKKSGGVEAQFSLNKELTTGVPGALQQQPELPQHHRVNLSDTGHHQALNAFSEDQSSGSLVMEGKIMQRADIQPMATANSLDTYMKLKKHQIHEAGKTKFTAQHLKKAPITSYRPVDRHSADVEFEKKKKTEMKRARDDKSKVYDLLFNAFQHHQYYTFKDLVNITKQPPVYLKEVLRELCDYNMKAPHKHMWELKTEYRHNTPSASAGAAADS